MHQNQILILCSNTTMAKAGSGIPVLRGEWHYLIPQKLQNFHEPRMKYMQVKKQHLELYMEQLTGCRLEKEYIKAVHCHPAYLISMQSTSCEMLGWMNHNLESRLPGEISTTSDIQMISL